MSLPLEVREPLTAFVCQPIGIMTVPCGRLFIDCRGLHAYFRISCRPVRGFVQLTIDVVRLRVAPQCRGRGYLRDVLSILESNPQRLPVYVESMDNLDLVAMYERRGYISVGDSGCDFVYQPK